MNKLMILAVAALLSPAALFAAETVTSVSVNPTVAEPSESVDITVDVSLSNGDTWRGTAYRFESGNYTCVDTANYTNNAPGTLHVSETFTVAAPDTDGIYDIDIRIYDASDCDDNDGDISSFDNDHVASGSANNGLEVATPVVVPPAPTPTPSTPSSGSTSGGGGYTYCDLHDGFAVGTQHNCIDRITGKVVQTLAWRGTPASVGGEMVNEELKIKLVQLVGVLQQMIQYLKTH